MNVVYVATSLDGYIADEAGGLGWLPAPSEADGDHGFGAFIAEIDAIVMGRVTFETVLGFDGDWPYPCPVYVLSRTLQAVPEHLTGSVHLCSGPPEQIVDQLFAVGHQRLYVDGGRVVRSFLAAGLIDRMILTRVPVVLGGGVPLFGALPAPQQFRHSRTRTLPAGLVQSTYDRVPA